MSHDTPTPEIRPESTYTFVSISTLEKRVRRHLARQSQTLIKARPEQADTMGNYAIAGADRTITRSHLDLAELGKELGALADHEVLDMGRVGWVWQVARQSVATEDGKRILRHEPITEAFTTEAAAHRAAADIGGDGIAVVGYYAGGERS